MREAPPELVELRRATAESVGWYHRGRRITEAQRDALTDTQRGESRWSADPQLVERLKAAEEAFTGTFRP